MTDQHYIVDFVHERSSMRVCAWGSNADEAINNAECILFEDYGIKPHSITIRLTPTDHCVEEGF